MRYILQSCSDSHAVVHVDAFGRTQHVGSTRACPLITPHSSVILPILCARLGKREVQPRPDELTRDLKINYQDFIDRSDSQHTRLGSNERRQKR
jgi:hypothetical protein